MCFLWFFWFSVFSGIFKYVISVIRKPIKFARKQLNYAFNIQKKIENCKS